MTGLDWGRGRSVQNNLSRKHPCCWLRRLRRPLHNSRKVQPCSLTCSTRLSTKGRRHQTSELSGMGLPGASCLLECRWQAPGGLRGGQSDGRRGSAPALCHHHLPATSSIFSKIAHLLSDQQKTSRRICCQYLLDSGSLPLC